MSNRLPRALLADIAAVIGSGDHASALMMLGDESGPEASAAVSSYRAQCAAALGDFDAAERHLRVALDLVERRMAALPADEAARERLAAVFHKELDDRVLDLRQLDALTVFFKRPVRQIQQKRRLMRL